MEEKEKKDEKLVFQALDWNGEDIENDEGEKQYKIRIFGRTIDDKTIHVLVNGFCPYFYIEFHRNWNKDQIIEAMKKKVYPKEHANSISGYEIVKKKKFYGFTNYTDFYFLQITFTNYKAMKAYEWVCSKKLFISSFGYVTLKPYESNINPVLRYMHIRQLDAMGWISINKNKLNILTTEQSCCELNYETIWTNLDHVDNKIISKFVICAFDLECTSEDGSFPQPDRDGDQIIQIGMTYSRFGENECFHKHILTLHETSHVEGAEVEWFDTEEKLLLAFTREIRKKNPDIITGYNIFGFDFKYLYGRCLKLGIQLKFERLSRINNEQSFYVKDRPLASAALGDNLLNYYEMKGRIIIDLLKVVSRDYKLPSYKLDDVASNFIKDGIIECCNKDKCCTIKTKNTYGLMQGQFVCIMYNDGVSDNKYKDGKKYHISELGKDYIIVDDNIDMSELKGCKVYWCQNKDDIHANDIFRMFKKTPDDRSIIAKYCIQDCVLCNKLINKLQIIPNNVSMANVCNVPLSYIFLRGQSVKIFSLVSKKCRERNHLITVLESSKFKKKKDNEDVEELENKEIGYEGATVFEPEVGVHVDPIAVLDYASLYPNSMIFRSLSHELLVNDPTFDNIPEYNYHEITFNNNDGTQSTCKFAERKDGKKGIIPEILIDLLTARKKYKKEMEEEKDNFKKSILNSLQLAYKITANSLYGQTGAKYSSICMKEIAASTTATGREMLQFSRYFVECKFNKFVNLALSTAKKDKKMFYKLMDKFYTYHPSIISSNGIIFHVCEKNDIKIPDSKFVRKEIGYETNIKLEDNDMKIIKDNEVEKMSPLDRLEFINTHEFISKNNVIEFIYNMGYKNKQEFFDMFYLTMNKYLKGYHINPKVMYGDTDSVFFHTNIYNENNVLQTDIKSLEISIIVGIWASIAICTVLPPPMQQEYEKIMYPLIMLSKKRYVGNLYEKTIHKFYQKNMGLVLVRRDSAPIAKLFCNGIVNYIINKHDPNGAIEFAKKTLKDIVSGKYKYDKFILSKTLRASYSETSKQRLAHVVLAERMGKRDLGAKPQANDRIPFIYIENKNAVLQGDRVEYPDYVVEHNLKIDYEFYIAHQIMKPAVQLLELIMKNPKQMFEYCIAEEQNKKNNVVPFDVNFKKSTNSNIKFDDFINNFGSEFDDS